MNLLHTALYVIIMGEVFFFLGLIFPREKFNENKFPYRLYKWERMGKIYDVINIKKWKTKVPDMSKFTRLIFPKKISGKIDAKKMDRLVKESCVAEFIHYLLVFVGFGIYRIWRNKTGILMVIIYEICNALFIFIQRYNRPHFMALRDKLKLREENNVHAITNG